MKKIFLLLFLFICTFTFAQQNNSQDVIHLKNGSIVKGTIIEESSNNYIKIEIAGGSILVYKMDEIDKIEKKSFEPITTPNPKPQKEKIPASRKGYVGLSINGSIPIGDFSTYNDQIASGFGGGINLNFGYKFSKYVGITSTINANMNYSDYNNDYYSSDWYDNIWFRSGILVGPLFSFPLGKKVELDIRPMAGSFSISNSYNNETSMALAADLGVMVRFNFTKWIALTVNSDLLVARSKYTSPYNRYEYINGNYNHYTDKKSFDYTLSNLNLGVGMVVRLK